MGIKYQLLYRHPLSVSEGCLLIKIYAGAPEEIKRLFFFLDYGFLQLKVIWKSLALK